MFTKRFEDIFTESALMQAFEQINKNASGLDEVDFEQFSKNLGTNIQKLQLRLLSATYTPEPLKRIEIDKPGSSQKRPIAISSLKDKIVQRALYNALSPYFEESFCDASYAYRSGKSLIKALNRTTNYINQKLHFVLKSDIDDFFETIDHDLLMRMLEKEIADKRILRLISLFLYTGAFFQNEYSEHLEGVHQGDILSPLLSNIYLDAMDKYLQSKEIAFVRYADDFVLLFEKSKDAHKALFELRRFLNGLHLRLEDEKTFITHIADGFTFLGVRFVGKNRHIDNERFQKTISKIHKLAKTKVGFADFVKNTNTYLYSLQNYYLKIIQNDSTQHRMLQNALIETVAQKVYLSKKNKSVTTKKEFRNLLQTLEWYILFKKNVKEVQELAIAKGIEKYLATKAYTDTKIKVTKKRNDYAKKFAIEATLHINTPGLMLGISKNKFVIKESGRVKHTYPLHKIKRIILEGKGFSLSSNVIAKCAQHSIALDFIDTNAIPYASLLSYNAATTQNIVAQAKVLGTPLQLQIARAFIKAKAKNQRNYLKYLDKYHNMLTANIDKIDRLAPKIKTAQDTAALMGIEGSIATLYWESIRLILDAPFEHRITQGAKDLVNSSLNYAYAILYGEVQHALVKAGLSLHISFLHAMDKTKPTLSYDLIEEFRTFIVDRTVFSMINKNEPLALDGNGMLTKQSRRLLANNVKERLGSYTLWRKRSVKIESIIQSQAYHLAKVISGDEKRYKPFIGKF